MGNLHLCSWGLCVTTMQLVLNCLWNTKFFPSLPAHVQHWCSLVIAGHPQAMLDAYERLQQQLAATQQQLAAVQQQLAEADSKGNHLAADYGVFKAKINSTLAAKAAHLTTLSDSLHQPQEHGPHLRALRELLQQQLAEATSSIKTELAAVHTALEVAGVPS